MSSFGSDPEFMVYSKGKPCSAIGIVDGDIDNRIDKDGHQFYCDNVLAECAIKPGYSKQEVVENFRECLSIYTQMVKPHTLQLQASYVFPESELMQEGARKVGCAIESCAYEMKQYKGPIELIAKGSLRSCGGHVHVGDESLMGDGTGSILMIYMMDLFLGVPSLWLDKDPSSIRRRELYGNAGRFREKHEYGIEYRSLGNFWLESPEMVGLIYDLTMFCLDLIKNGPAWEMWDFDIERFIESGELKDAWQCKTYDVDSLREGINRTKRSKVDSHMKLALSMLPEQLRSNLQSLIDRPEPVDMYKAWQLG